MVEKSSFNLVFHYLKEVLRLVIRNLAGQSSERGKTLVQCDSHGLPTIIPWKLREQILLVRLIGPLKEGYDRPNPNIIVAILTAISIFRVFQTSVKPSLKTIVEPFKGKTRTLNVSLILASLVSLFGEVPNLKFKSIKLLLLETAGPNSSKSTWTSGIDAIAFLYHPVSFYNFLRLNLNYGLISFWLSL